MGACIRSSLLSFLSLLLEGFDSKSEILDGGLSFGFDKHLLECLLYRFGGMFQEHVLDSSCGSLIRSECVSDGSSNIDPRRCDDSSSGSIPSSLAEDMLHSSHDRSGATRKSSVHGHHSAVMAADKA